MNERIFDMARQSGATDEQGGRSQEVFCFTKSELNAFAELIVRECANWMDNERDESGDRISDSFYWADRMKKHFGVENG